MELNCAERLQYTLYGWFFCASLRRLPPFSEYCLLDDDEDQQLDGRLSTTSAYTRHTTPHSTRTWRHWAYFVGFVLTQDKHDSPARLSAIQCI